MIKKKDLRPYFPFKKIRRQQYKAIKRIIRAFMSENKKYVILEAGTGVGKSAIGVCVSRYLQKHLKINNKFQNSSYFLTTQKILQQQYINDFSSNNILDDIEDSFPCNTFRSSPLPSQQQGLFRSISSATNYKCRSNPNNNCAEIRRINAKLGKFSNFNNDCKDDCVYKKTKELFMEEVDGVTNFAYFLAETMYAKEFKPRKLLVIDEAHNCDLEMSGFIDMDINDEWREKLDIEIPTFITQNEYYMWIKNTYEPLLMEKKKELEKQLSNGNTNLINENEIYDKYACKVRRFIKYYHNDNWVMNITKIYNRLLGNKTDRLEFKPIDVSNYSSEMLFQFGHKVLLMSATILDKNKFCKLNGINMNDATFISYSSPFPIENHPLRYYPIGSMGQLHLDSSLPNLVKAIEKILKKHKNEKGIVHCHNYKIMKYIKNHINNKYRKRILTHNSKNRDKILEQHMKSTLPTVIISPSMSEGVDLKDEYSRFQVICKVPYPYLGDGMVKKRCDKWKWWYSYETTKRVVQSVGRSVRNKNDHATTYILDKCWERFYQDNQPLFPKNFHYWMSNG